MKNSNITIKLPFLPYYKGSVKDFAVASGIGICSYGFYRLLKTKCDLIDIKAKHPQDLVPQNKEENSLRFYVRKELNLDDCELKVERLHEDDTLNGDTASFICGPYLKQRGITVLAGAPGSGKSILAMQIALCIANGETLHFTPDYEAKGPQNVYYFDPELGTDDMSERYGKVDCARLHRIPCHSVSIYRILDKIIQLEKRAEAGSDATIILDGLSLVLKSTTSADSMADFINGLKTIKSRAIRQRKNLSFIITTHTTKDGARNPEMKDVAGSAAITRIAQAVFTLRKDNGQYELKCEKCRYGEEPQLKRLQISTVGYLHFEAVSERENNASKKPSMPSREEQIRALKVAGSSREAAKLLCAEGHKVSHTTIATTVRKYSQEK